MTRQANDSRARETAEALVRSFGWLCTRLPGGSVKRTDTTTAAISGIQAPSLNGAWCPVPEAFDSTAARKELRDLLAEIATTRLPYCLQFPTGAHQLRNIAQHQGMIRAADIPLMRLDQPPIMQAVAGLHVRQIESSEARQHVQLVARGFQSPLEIFEPLAGPQVATRPELSYYLGELEGTKVTTGLSLRLDDRAGVFNVATPAEHRRRGYGGALTAKIMADEFAADASWAWLQSSRAGLGMYTNLGFDIVSTWECWIAG